MEVVITLCAHVRAWFFTDQTFFTLYVRYFEIRLGLFRFQLKLFGFFPFEIAD